MGDKGHCDEISEMKNMLRQWRKGNPCYKVTKDLAELWSRSSVLWKVELVSNEIGYLAQEIFMQSVEGAVQFLLTV